MSDNTIMILCFLALGGYAFIKIKSSSKKKHEDTPKHKHEEQKLKNIVKERKKKIEYWKKREIELKYNVSSNSIKEYNDI